VSRRQHTTLIVQVRIPVPAGKTQAATLELIRNALTTNFLSYAAQIQVKITGRETTYL
jgi:hypothetical protein